MMSPTLDIVDTLDTLDTLDRVQAQICKEGAMFFNNKIQIIYLPYSLLMDTDA